ncbi:MAG: DnaD domain protein [Clostridia bacterium]|nr:DnaD domain protein [Clostridia bacterium]
MSFAKFSSDFLMETFTLVDNLFINEFLPECDEKQIKVYLYGLYLCANPAKDNSIDALCTHLNMSEKEIRSIYANFEDMGLCQIVSKEPLEVKYLSLKRANQPPKKYKAEKWNDFNAHLQQLFPERMLTPNEYNEYYSFIDATKFEPEALLLVVQYCINLKGMGVRYPYILTVARNWAAEGVRTANDVEEKLEEYERQHDDMQKVLSALSRKGGAELEEKQMLLKWTRSWGFELNAIIAAAKTLKGSKTFQKLDAKLDEFYRMSIFSAEEMTDYAKHLEELRSLAIEINKTLGVFYESFEHEIEVYVSPWVAKGFEERALVKIAHQCFVSSVRSLEGMDKVVGKFYAMGLLTSASIDDYVAAQLKQDENIKRIIEATGRTRGVTKQDREYYHTWSAQWLFDDSVIIYAAEQAANRSYPLPYINQILSIFKSAGVKTVEDAKKVALPSASTQKQSRDFDEREYSEDELRAVITSIDGLNVNDDV